MNLRLEAVGVGFVIASFSVVAHAAPRGPDFDNDGYQDLAITSPEEDCGTSPTECGSVNLLWGSSTGLVSPGGKTAVLVQGSGGVEGAAESADEFGGGGLAWGNFNDDCYDDLIVGIPAEDVANPVITDGGAIQVFYGYSGGLSTTNDEIFYRGFNGLSGTPGTQHYFGEGLAVGDFDGDDYDDVAVGVANDADKGSVHIIYGSASGLTGTGSQIINQDSGSVPESGEVGDDSFGQTLAAGDFNCDGFDDLAVGNPSETINGKSAGAVTILYGSASGLSTGADSEIFYQDLIDMLESSEDGDGFSVGNIWGPRALAVGNFNGNTANGEECMDLAIGIPFKTVDGVKGGAVAVVYGTAASGLQLASPNDQFFHQNFGSIEGSVEAGDNFGYTLEVGRYDCCNSYDDLVIAVPGEDSEGAVGILLGSGTGLTDSNDVLWKTSNFGGIAMGFDVLGRGLGVGDFDDDRTIDLAVGAPGYDVGSENMAGKVYVGYFDATSTPSLAATDEFTQDDVGTQTAEQTDRFGMSMTGAGFRSAKPDSCDGI